MLRPNKGTVFLAQKRQYLAEGINNIITIGFTYKKHIRRESKGIASVHCVYTCHGSLTTYKKIRTEFQKVYGDPVSSSMKGFQDYYVTSIDEAIATFNAIVQMHARYARRVDLGTLKTPKKLSMIFPKYNRDISFCGKKRYVQIRWIDGEVKYIHERKIRTEPITNFLKKGTRTGYFSVNNYCLVVKEGETHNLTGAVTRHLNQNKMKIVLPSIPKKFPEIGVWLALFNKSRWNDSCKICTRDYIDNILFKNAMIYFQDFGGYLYCVVEHDNVSGIYCVTIDTSGILEYQGNKKSLKIDLSRNANSFYEISEPLVTKPNQNMDNLSEMFDKKLVLGNDDPKPKTKTEHIVSGETFDLYEPIPPYGSCHV